MGFLFKFFCNKNIEISIYSVKAPNPYIYLNIKTFSFEIYLIGGFAFWGILIYCHYEKNIKI